jgi:alkanesulfonate monooxygenase SsuD/methylene tetrahydromethanopterin reductase-like flavin-dependent oxidoreductase (luciferase family)
VPFPPRKERFALLEETLQMAHQMWRGEDAPFDGAHLHLGRTLNSPNALQRPHPPILIGGMGEQRTFGLIARYGDACNIFTWGGMDTVARKYAALRERCAEVGRDYAAIEKTTLSELLVTRDGRIPPGTHPLPEPPTPITPAQAIAHFADLAAIGTDHAIINTPIIHLPGAFDVWATEIIPAVTAMVPAGR